MSVTRASALGRPRDPELTHRLLSGALSIVALDGFHQLNADALCRLAGAGKAGLYRRWPDTTALLAEAVRTTHLVTPPSAAASVRADLVGLLAPWTRPLDENERAAAALLGPARHLADIHAALHEALTAPLTQAVHTILDHHVARGHEITGTQRNLTMLVIHALWSDRYLTNRPASTSAQLDELVARVLLPLLQ